MKKVVFLLLCCALMFCGCSEAACKHDDPTQIVVVEVVEPTCHQTGLTEGMKCGLCGTMVVPQTAVATIDCIESNWIVDKEATKTEDGKRHTECVMCGETFKEQILGAGSQGLSYAESMSGKCSVRGIGSCQDVDLIIPQMYYEKPVTRINDGAFSGCTSLVSIVIPDGVIAIGPKVFWDCSALKSITIPHSVGRIDGLAFNGCTSLSNIYYDGTMEEWDRIGRNTGWNICSDKVTIFCTDGEISN